MAGGGKAFGNKGRGDKKAETTHHHSGWASIFSMLFLIRGFFFQNIFWTFEFFHIRSWGHGVGKSKLRIFCFVVLLLVQSCTLAPSGIKKKQLLASFFWSLFPSWSMVMLGTKCFE